MRSFADDNLGSSPNRLSLAGHEVTKIAALGPSILLLLNVSSIVVYRTLKIIDAFHVLCIFSNREYVPVSLILVEYFA